MQQSPLATVKERFGDKAGLVKAIEGLATPELWVDRINAGKGLMCVSNRKLLHLHQVLAEVQSQFGSREQLIAGIAELERRSNDADYKRGLESAPTPKLYSQYLAAKKRQKHAS